MFLIQQSPSFRAWTSRALILYFRRALLFLVVSPHETINKNICLLQQQQTVYFSDAKDHEEKMVFTESLYERNENNSNQIKLSQSKRNLLKEYVFKKLSQGLNNSMAKTTNSSFVRSINESISTSISSSSIEQSSEIFDSIQPPTEQFELNTLNSNQDSSSFSSWQQTPINCHNQIYTFPLYSHHFNGIVPMVSHPISYIYEKRQIHSNLQYCPPSSTCDSSDNETSSSKSNNPLLPRSSHRYSSTSIEQNVSQSSDDENNIYEKYQTSFSHILHQTKSQHTIRKEDKIQSRLSLEPNTSIVTIRQLIFHPNYIDSPIITSDICVRLIADRTDLSIQCDTKPMGCKKTHNNQHTFGCFPIKSISINIKQQEKSNPNSSIVTPTAQSIISKYKATSILIDIPFRMLYIDSLI